MSDKDSLLKRLYYNELGYQSINNLYKEAKKEDNNMTLNYVRDWYQHFKTIKTQLKGQNSFIAPEPYYEYQIDLFFLTDQPKPNIGLACIDIFTKYAVVVPLNSKQTEDITDGLYKSIKLMRKKPKTLYTDDEAAYSSSYFKTYLSKIDIKHIITRTHPYFVERFIRTFKNLLYSRLEDMDKSWVELIDPILHVYNNKMISSATKLTPEEARKPENLTIVKSNLELKRQHTRKYPDIELGDTIKIYKKKDKLDKENKSIWLPGLHTVEDIKKEFGQTFFKVSGFPKYLMRHEILKI